MNVYVAPSNTRAANRRRSFSTELALHGVNTSRRKTAKSVTHVSGTECHPCLGPLSSLHELRLACLLRALS